MTTGEQLFVACLSKGDSKVLSVVQRKWLDGVEITQHNTIMEYYKDHGELMGVRTFCDMYKLEAREADSRPVFYLNLLKERFIFSMLSDKIPEIVRGLKSDPRKKLSDLQSIVATLSVDAVESNDVLYSEDTERRVADYEERMKCLGVTYLSTGSPDLDMLTYGYRKQDLITIGGRAGSGKSWMLVYMAHLLEYVLKEQAEMGNSFGDILFITNEMGEEEIMERLDCIRFRLPYERFMKGTLTEKEKQRYYRGLNKLKKNKSKIRIVYSCQTIDELSTYIGLYHPCAVFLDGSYLMEGKMQEGWEKIAFITRNLKRIGKSFKVPIINTTQLKRGSGKGSSKGLDGQDDFAYGNSYSQDSDIAIRMFQDPDMRFHDLVGCEIVKGRRVASGTTFMFENCLTSMNHSITLPVEDGPERKEDY